MADRPNYVIAATYDTADAGSFGAYLTADDITWAAHDVRAVRADTIASTIIAGLIAVAR